MAKGRTQAMLEEVVASDAERVAVVVHSSRFAGQVAVRLIEMLPTGAKYEIVAGCIKRRDGRKIYIMPVHLVERKLRGAHDIEEYWDHACYLARVR